MTASLVAGTLHLAGEQPLVPDVRKSVAQQHGGEQPVRERQRAVGVATHGLAVGRHDAGGEPELPEVDVGEDRARARRLTQEDAGEMAGAAAQVERAPGRGCAAVRAVRCSGAGASLRADRVYRVAAGGAGMPAASQRVEQRLDEQAGRVREPMEHIVRLGVQAQHTEEIAIGRPAGDGGQLAKGVEPRTVQAQQHMERVVAPARFQRVHGVAGRVVGDEDRNPCDHREGAALAAQNAGFDAVPPAVERGVLDDRQARAAERAPEHVERLDQHGGTVRPPLAG